MVRKGRPVVSWSKRAYAALQKIVEYIRQDSITNAEKVKEGILKITRGLPDHPAKHPPDKFKKNNPGNYRAFEKYSYRVAYRHTQQQIKILRIRHVRQEPLEY
jgi:plasmid stabilization system protein ParE